MSIGYRWKCTNCEEPNAPRASSCSGCGCPAIVSGIERELWNAEKGCFDKREIVVYRKLQRLLELSSGEWMLTKGDRANGGTIILLRSLQVATLVFLFAALLEHAIGDGKPSVTWYGAIFAAAYAAFYTRFASQWIYLSNLYNKIKETEAIMTPDCEARLGKLAEWKAGFIEDAEYLHMVRKKSFAPIIKAWGKEDQVKKKYCDNTPGGETRLNQVLLDSGETCRYIEENYDPT